MDLACHYAGVAGAAEVAERQATHTGDVTRYVHDVCTRYDAFRGATSGLGAVYATAVTSALDGLDRSTRAAQRWGGAARETADDLAGVDALARRVVERLADLFPGLPDDLVPVTPVAPDVALGAALPSSEPGALGGPGGSPVPLDRMLGVDPRWAELGGLAGDRAPEEPGDGAEDLDGDEDLDDDGDAGDEDAGDDERPTDTTDDHAPWRSRPGGLLGSGLGSVLDLGQAAEDAVDAVDGLGESMEAAGDAQDDAAAYDELVARSGR